MYISEKIMSADFEKYLRSMVGNTYYKEWQGLFGIPDYVCFSKQGDKISVVSFELKLTDWRGALVQAFRYKSFSDYSYVVLPKETAIKASENQSIFEQYGIGLASFNGNSYDIIYRPCRVAPYSNRLREIAEGRIKRSRKHAINSVNSIL